MPAKRSAMRQKIRKFCRLKFEVQMSHERIAAATGLSKGAVSKYVQRRSARNLSWPLPEDLDDAVLERLLFPQSCSASTSCTPTTPMCTRSSSAKG